MRILFYLSRFPGWGGIETVTEILGNKLLDMGYQVDLLVHIKQDRQSELLNRVNYFIMPDEGKWLTPNNIAFAEGLVRENNYSVIIYQDSYANTEQIAIKMRNVGCGKLIVCEHNVPNYNQKKSYQYVTGVSLPIKLYRQLFSLPKQIKEDRKRHYDLLQASDAYVLLCEGFREELFDVCGTKWIKDFSNKIYSINNPIIPPTYDMDCFDQKENIILFVGQINHQKRVDIMIDAWKIIKKQLSDWKFQIVGDGPLCDEMKMKVNHDMIEGVVFCGFQQPKKYYQKAKVFWMTSSYEGWGMTLVEAMGNGCVPIGMNTYAAIHDIIDDGLNGFITPANDLDTFVNKSLLLMRNDNSRAEMAYAALRKVWRFDAERIANQWNDLIHCVTKA